MLLVEPLCKVFFEGKTVTCCTMSTNIKGCQVVALLYASCVRFICAVQVVGPIVKTNHIYNGAYG